MLGESFPAIFSIDPQNLSRFLYTTRSTSVQSRWTSMSVLFCSVNQMGKKIKSKMGAYDRKWSKGEKVRGKGVGGVRAGRGRRKLTALREDLSRSWANPSKIWKMEVGRCGKRRSPVRCITLALANGAEVRV